MKRPNPILGGAIVGVVLIGLVIVMLKCRADPTPIPERERKTGDSLSMTKPGYRARIDTFVIIDSFAVNEARRIRIAAETERRRGDAARRAADDLRRQADARAESAGDSVAAWKTVAGVYKAESDSLRVADSRHTAEADSLRSVVRADSVALNARARLNREQAARVIALEDYSARLVSDLHRADPPCRVMRVLRCPSRKATVVLTVVAAGGAALVAKLKPWEMLSP